MKERHFDVTAVLKIPKASRTHKLLVSVGGLIFLWQEDVYGRVVVVIFACGVDLDTHNTLPIEGRVLMLSWRWNGSVDLVESTT